MSKNRKKKNKMCPDCGGMMKIISHKERAVLFGEEIIDNKKFLTCAECGYKQTKQKKHKIKLETEDKNTSKW